MRIVDNININLIARSVLSDEAIWCARGGDCFAALAMTGAAGWFCPEKGLGLAMTRDMALRGAFLATKQSGAGPGTPGLSINELAQVLNRYFDLPVEKEPAEIQSNHPTGDQGDPPICPKCGIPMLLRKVGQGEHKGKQFYGCQNFPRCREMKPSHPEPVSQPQAG